MSRKRLFAVFAAAVLLALAVAGHVSYHYLPRARPASPGGQTPGQLLLASDEFPIALWMPFPHQNLSFLRATAGLDGDGLRALARLAGLPSPGLPSFGSMAVPPASEIAIASDESGERWAVLAQVYPAFAAFARLSGRLADNPWLKGGEIYSEGRPAEVSWRGNLWTVASPGFPDLSQAPEDLPASDPALAVVRMRQAIDPLPAGSYRLIQRTAAPHEVASQTSGGRVSGFEVVSGAWPPDERGTDFETLGLPDLGVFLLVAAGSVPALGEPAQAMVFFATGDGNELPRVASICEPGGERWSLPGESILELGGRSPRQSQTAGWRLAALDSAGLEGASALAPGLSGLLNSAPSPAWALWLDLETGLREVSLLAEGFAEVPIVPRRRLERWRDAEIVLTPLAQRFRRVTATVRTEPRAFRLRLLPAEE